MKVLLNVTEQLTAKMMENYILASGAEAMVLSASSKETLLELTASYQPDIFAYYLTDDDTISLNELFAAVKRLCPRTRTLLVAGKNKMAATDEMAEVGFDEYIAVPFEISEVMLRLRRLFRQLQNDTPPVQRQDTPMPSYIPPAQEPLSQPSPPPAYAPVYTPVAEQRDNTPAAVADTAILREPERQAVAYAPPAAQPEFLPAVEEPQPVAQVSLPAAPAQKESPVRGQGLKRILGYISRAFFIALILVIAALAFLLVKSKFDGGTPTLMGYQLYGVISGSMSGNQKDSFDTGSLVFVKPISAKDIREGDIITFRGVGVNSPLTTHRVVKINNEGGKLSFTTRGDANNVDDPNPIPAERIVGTVRGSVPLLGYLTSFAQTRTGLVFLIFIPGGFVIAYETVNIFRTVKEENKKRKPK